MSTLVVAVILTGRDADQVATELGQFLEDLVDGGELTFQWDKQLIDLPEPKEWGGNVYLDMTEPYQKGRSQDDE